MGSPTPSGRLWDATAHDWAELQEPVALPLWAAMIDAAAVGHGTRLLDAGCGAGGASVLAVGRGAQVNGLDAAPALLAIARARVPDGDFCCGDLAALPYAAETFDAIIAADVLPYLADPLAALREVRRVCAPHGRVVLAVLGAPEQCAQYAIMMSVQELLQRPLDDGPFALSAPDLLDGLIEQAELTISGQGTVICPAEYPDEETYWLAQASVGHLQAVLRQVGAAPLKAALLGAVASCRTSMGRVHLENCFRYVVATPQAERSTAR